MSVFLTNVIVGVIKPHWPRSCTLIKVEGSVSERQMNYECYE